MSRHLAHIVLHPPGFLQGQHHEAAAPTHLHHHGQEAWVDCAVVTVVCVARDPQVLIALVLLGGQSVDMSKLGGADAGEVKSSDCRWLLTLTGVQHYCFNNPSQVQISNSYEKLRESLRELDDIQCNQIFEEKHFHV